MEMTSALTCVGQWSGKSTLYLPAKPPDVSESKLTVTPLLGGRFVRFDYTWTYHKDGAEKPQQASLLLGAEQACWVDTWHMSERMLICTVAGGADGAWWCLGSFAAPPGPDWGWRIECTPHGSGGLRIVMYCIEPGQERGDLAVEAEYSRLS